MAGSEGEKRREEIFELLSKASVEGKEPKPSQGSRFSPRNTRQEPLKLASTHQLVEGRNIGYSHDTNKHFHSRSARKPNRRWTLLIIFNSGQNPNSGSQVPIWEWMKSIRKADALTPPVSSFYFPDNKCGPDIVFSLEPKDSSDPRVLCVLQVSLGPSAELDGLLTFVRLKS